MVSYSWAALKLVFHIAVSRIIQKFKYQIYPLLKSLIPLPVVLRTVLRTICSYSSFIWLVFPNFLKIFGCVVTLINDGLYWIEKVASTYSVCSCLGLFSHETSHLSENQADWRFCVSRESQGNVLTGSLFQVPLGKKQVTEQETPPGLVYSTPRRECFLTVTLNLLFSVFAWQSSVWRSADFPLRQQHLHKRTFLATLPTCPLDFENSSWAFTAKQKLLLPNCSSVYTCRGRELNFPSCLESKWLNNDLGLAPDRSPPSVFVDSPWGSLVTC